VTTVLVIEDEPRTVEVLMELTRHLGYVSVAARTGAQGVQVAREQQPDLILLDLGLPDLGGLRVIGQLREFTDAPILVVSGSTQRRRKADALDAGADDFVDKPFEVAELRARLAAAERRLTSGADRAVRRSYGQLTVDHTTRQIFDGEVEIRLTETEWLILDLLTKAPGRVLTHRRIVQHIWGPTAGAEARGALRTHMRSLRAKLGDEARDPVYLRTESGVGYRWIHPPGPAAPVSSRESRSVADAALALGDAVDLLLATRGSSVSESPEGTRIHELVEEIQQLSRGLTEQARAGRD
jgi:two-component system KDP operon response regulator KdpE